MCSTASMKLGTWSLTWRVYVCLWEKETDRLPQVLKPGIYHSLLIPPLLSSASPLAGALWLGRKTAVRERPVLMISPLCASSDFTTSLSKQNSCGTYWTCVRIGNPRPAEEKRQSEGYSRPECALQVASESVEGIALGEPSFTFHKGLLLGFLILSLPSTSMSTLLGVPLPLKR